LDGRTIHVELLLTIVPDPGEDLHASREVCRNGEGEVLTLWSVPIVAMRTIALIRCDDVKGLTMIG
jgi:hypothetical protein